MSTRRGQNCDPTVRFGHEQPDSGLNNLARAAHYVGLGGLVGGGAPEVRRLRKKDYLYVTIWRRRMFTTMTLESYFLT